MLHCWLSYVLSHDLVWWAQYQATALPRLPAIEDALVGALVHGNATLVNRPAAVRFKAQGTYTSTVCEKDTEFAILHKLSIKDLQRCGHATRVRRSAHCPTGPCKCRNLGRPPHRKSLMVSSLKKKRELHKARNSSWRKLQR